MLWEAMRHWVTEHWGFRVKPASRAAKNVALQPGRLRLRHSRWWRIPGSLFPFHPGCERIRGLQVADVSTCGAPSQASVDSIQPRDTTKRGELPHLGGQTMYRRLTTSSENGSLP